MTKFLEENSLEEIKIWNLRTLTIYLCYKIGPIIWNIKEHLKCIKLLKWNRIIHGFMVKLVLLNIVLHNFRFHSDILNPLSDYPGLDQTLKLELSLRLFWPFIMTRPLNKKVQVKIIFRISKSKYIYKNVSLFVLLLYVPSQQLWSWRDGQFT